ncbi:MAG: hypothetical protein A2381_08475 [Bdellovibrionales bacterium RIFOXYB1_FULL_37_110]|nr:MAG: hypothetical protein A2417_14150 [Bdellovibrionales bacterium RIFOXYC1_FULL_37_79]OFZ58241.1 MAG: hypothetical protein A2381_08475 [Bdellovibrionales bacterium RIFOXYB1_FULL_37_110]OFZ62286.1 MAG: hypothetical protein A2577_17060 [Bdellovibrionales bacterium RIFOXYD1_FULL_36_51]
MLKLDHFKNPGIIYSLLNALLLGVIGALAKKVSFTMPSSEIVFFRGVFSLVIIASVMIYRHDSFVAGDKKMLITRGIFGGLGLLTFFYTISKMKLGDASILLQMAPVFVILFARVFLKEPIPKSFYLIILLALTGAIFVIKPTFENLISFPAITGISSAVFAAAAYISIRKLGIHHSPFLITCYFIGGSILFSIPLMIPAFKIPTLSEILYLLMIGVFSAFGQICLTRAYQLEKAGIVSIIGFSAVIHHGLWGYLAFGELLDVYSIIGGTLILACCTYIMVPSTFAHKKIVRLFTNNFPMDSINK